MCVKGNRHTTNRTLHLLKLTTAGESPGPESLEFLVSRRPSLLLILNEIFAAAARLCKREREGIAIADNSNSNMSILRRPASSTDGENRLIKDRRQLLSPFHRCYTNLALEHIFIANCN